MDYKDYYRVLGVSRQANDKDIKQAYRNLARQYHPDVNPSMEAEERFKEINEAYTVLSDPESRRRYDDLGVLYQEWAKSGKKNNFDWDRWSKHSPPKTAEDPTPSRFSDFFNAIFGDNTRRKQQDSFSHKAPIRGQDVDYEVTISLEEAYRGTNCQVKRGTRSFNAHIPPGVTTGTRIRFAGQGESGFAGGNAGDLFVTVTVKPQARYERRDDDLYMEIDVPLYTAVLGGDVRVSTLGGDVRLRIPIGTQSGDHIRLKGRGMPSLKSENAHGDLYARVFIKIPSELSADEIELFEQLAQMRL